MLVDDVVKAGFSEVFAQISDLINFLCNDYRETDNATVKA